MTGVTADIARVRAREEAAMNALAEVMGVMPSRMIARNAAEMLAVYDAARAFDAQWTIQFGQADRLPDETVERHGYRREPEEQSRDFAIRDLLNAAKRALNYIENTESDLGMKLSTGDWLRLAIPAFEEHDAPLGSRAQQARDDVLREVSDQLHGFVETERPVDYASAIHNAPRATGNWEGMMRAKSVVDDMIAPSPASDRNAAHLNPGTTSGDCGRNGEGAPQPLPRTAPAVGKIETDSPEFSRGVLAAWEAVKTKEPPFPEEHDAEKPRVGGYRFGIGAALAAIQSLTSTDLSSESKARAERAAKLERLYAEARRCCDDMLFDEHGTVASMQAGWGRRLQEAVDALRAGGIASLLP